MKRVRYLVGAAGLAPMAIGTVAAGGAHSAAAGVTGHGTTVAARGTLRPWGPIPDIERVDCAARGDWLIVSQSDFAGQDCFANAGHENVKIYHIDAVYTGNNGVDFVVDYKGVSYGCSQPFKNTWVNVSSCPQSPPFNDATMTFLSIYPGITDSAIAKRPPVSGDRKVSRLGGGVAGPGLSERGRR